MPRNFKKLKIFHLSYQFLLDIYGALPLLPDSELRNVYSQLQRAATSVVLNIAEGSSSRSEKVFFNHLQYSFGSCSEVEVLLFLCRDLHYFDSVLFDSLFSSLDRLKASLFSFMSSVEKSLPRDKGVFVKNDFASFSRFSR